MRMRAHELAKKQAVFTQNHSYQNVFRLQVYFLVNQTHFHAKGFARGLVLKTRHKVTRKWSISSVHVGTCRVLQNILTITALTYQEYCKNKHNKNFIALQVQTTTLTFFCKSGNFGSLVRFILREIFTFIILKKKLVPGKECKPKSPSNFI